MKNIKSFMLVILLTAGSNVFAARDKDLEQIYEQFKKDIKKAFDEREYVRKNGTPLQKASIETTDLALSAAGVAFTVGTCSFVVNSVLGSFEATKDIEHRGTIATGMCASTLTALYASMKYEEMQKSQKKQNSSWF